MHTPTLAHLHALALARARAHPTHTSSRSKGTPVTCTGRLCRVALVHGTACPTCHTLPQHATR